MTMGPFAGKYAAAAGVFDGFGAGVVVDKGRRMCQGHAMM